MDLVSLRREVERLAPWYYAFELNGVRTDTTKPVCERGYRDVRLPTGFAPLLRGKVVLDVGCNEGGFTFQALELGAARVDAFDCRPINIEKARLVAKVVGYENVRFHVASADSWLAVDREPVDYVFLCGLLYHLPDPWRTVKDYCRCAREGVFITAVLGSGPDGYTEYYEGDTIAANEDSRLPAQMPNTTETLIDEFAKHSFWPRYISESAVGEGVSGCWMLLENGSRWPQCTPGPRTRRGDLDVYVTPTGMQSDLEADVVIRRRFRDARLVEVRMIVRAEDGRVVHEQGPERVSFPALREAGAVSETLRHPVRLPCPPQGARHSITVETLGGEPRKPLGMAELIVDGPCAHGLRSGPSSPPGERAR